MRGAGGTPGGLGAFLAGSAIGALIIVVGIIASLQVYFRATSLFDTLLILGLLAGGLGLVARSLRAQGSGAEGSYPATR
jgi:hypothetical protein